jgi:hypothetical protein
VTGRWVFWVATPARAAPRRCSYRSHEPPVSLTLAHMKLVRVAVVCLSRNPEATPWSWLGQDAEVRVQAHPLDRPDCIAVVADIDLSQRPDVTSDRLILAPEAERRQLEQSIEQLADLLAIARKAKRKIYSAVPEAALRDLDKEDREWLGSVAGFAVTGINRIHVDSSMPLSDLPVAALTDRHDGVTLLAEALSSDHETGRFRELCRVLERAFACGPFELIDPVTSFLQHFTELDYCRDEVDYWLRVLRHLATHADRREQFATAADVYPVLGRLEQAAYDVLLNKMNWRSRDIDRRHVWTPFNGVLRDNGAVQLDTHTGYISSEVLDAFGVYPYGRDFHVPVPDDWYAIFPERVQRSGRLKIVKSM